MRSTDVQSATANRYNESDAGQNCGCFGAALEQRLDKLRKEEEEEKSSKRQRRIEDLKQDRAWSVAYRGAHPVILHAIRCATHESAACTTTGTLHANGQPAIRSANRRLVRPSSPFTLVSAGAAKRKRP